MLLAFWMPPRLTIIYSDLIVVFLVYIITELDPTRVQLDVAQVPNRRIVALLNYRSTGKVTLI